MKTAKIVLILFLVLSAASCDRNPIPPPQPVVEYMTVRQLRELYDKGVTVVDTAVFIKGVITLTPELNNLPSFVAYLQDSTAGICLTATGTNTFTMDSEVKVECEGLSFTLYNGLLQFGDINIADQSELVSLTPDPVTPVTVTIAQLLAGEHQAEYVRLENVQFKDPGTFSGSKKITDCTSEMDVYTKAEATFSGETLPTGNGYIMGIASVFTSEQLLLRNETENDMTGERCGSSGVIYLLPEDFSSLNLYDDVSNLEGWKTYSQEGTKTWYCNVVSGYGKWVQTTAYLSGQASVITWMITPALDLTAAVSPYISFESANGKDNGATLELFASSDYNGSATPWTSTWTALSFTKPPLNSTGWSDFVSSGQVDLSAWKGAPVYVAWVYKGGTDKTTTWEVDNVLAAEK